MNGRDEQRGQEYGAPGRPDGWDRCVHWHRTPAWLLRNGNDEADKHLVQTRWLCSSFGFAIEEVHQGEPGDHVAYTVGLSQYGHPEFILTGQPYENAFVILCGFAWQVVSQERRFIPSSDPVAIGGLEVYLLARENTAVLVLANAFNEGPVEALNVRLDWSPILPRTSGGSVEQDR